MAHEYGGWLDSILTYMRKLYLTILAVVACISMLAAQQSISGTVKDLAGEPLIGASVLVKGTTSGTVTDFDGFFKVGVENDDAVLVISYTGFTSKEIPINGQSVIDVTLEEGVTLNQAVVTALGVTRDEKSLGYAVQQLDGDELTKARESNVVSAFTGRVAGVQINSNNSGLGGSVSVLLRGATSITGNNQPLFVVDGTPIANSNFNSSGTANASSGRDFGNAIQDINPDDIANISILKGGAAAALYGARAANGVVLITTKSGKNRNGLGVTINSGVTMQNVAVLPSYQNQYGGGYNLDFQTFEFDPAAHPAEWEAFDGQLTPNYNADESWGPRLDGTPVRHWDSWYPGETFGELRPWTANPDNVRDFYETGATYTNNVAISGGDEKSNFRLSYTNLNQGGVYPGSQLDRNTFSINANTKVGDRISVGVSGTYVATNGEGRPGVGYGGFGNQINVQTNFNQWFQRQLDIDRLANFEQPDGSPRTWNLRSPTNRGALFWESPYWVVNRNLNFDQRDRLFGNVSLSYEITKGLSITGFARSDYYDFTSNDRIASGSASDLAFYELRSRRNRENNFELLLEYDKTFGDFSVNANLGGNIRKEDFQSSSARTDGGLSVPGLYTIEASINRPSRTDFRSQRRVNSAYGRVGVGWKNLLYVDVTARNDWTSTLSSDNWSFFYPSVSTSFVFSELLPGNSILSFGKLRAGVATVGNDTDPYNTQNVFTATDFFGSNPTFAVPNTQRNPDLTAEEIATWEIGLDMRFLRDRISFDVTYYDIESRDLIIPLDVSGATGFNATFVNAGKITNQGIEASLFVTPIQKENFAWTIGANLARNVNEVVELAEGQNTLTLGNWGPRFTATVGQPYGTIWADGFTRNDDGERLVGEEGLFLREDFEPRGSAYPDWTGGIINDITLFGFNIGTVVDFRRGGSLYSVTNRYGEYSGILESTVGVNDRGTDWRLPIAEGGGIRSDGVKEDGTPNDVYIRADEYFKQFVNRREAYIFDASFVKLREVSISKNIPAGWLANLPVQSARVSLIGRNLAILHRNAPNIDPESATSNSNIQGFENGQNPSVRSVGFNLNVKF